MTSRLHGAVPYTAYLIVPPTPGLISCQGPIIQFIGADPEPLGIGVVIQVVV